MARHDVLPDYPRPGSHDMVRRVVDCYEYAGLVSHLSLSGCQAVAWPEDLWGTACGMGLGWPSIISRACALAAHAITEYGKSDCLWNAGSIAEFRNSALRPATVWAGARLPSKALLQ